MSDADERRAGAVILKDLALFNKAAILYEDKIEPEILSAISSLASDWLRKQGWTGQSDVSSYLGNLWVCPASWKEESQEPLAKFTFVRRIGNDSASYALADLFGVGQTNWGFKFDVVPSWFGGRNAWNAFAKGREMAALVEEAGKRGWVHEGKGVFFRPLILPAERLAAAWELEDWTEALAPLGEALDSLLADHAIFDEIVMMAQPGATQPATTALPTPVTQDQTPSGPTSRKRSKSP